MSTWSGITVTAPMFIKLSELKMIRNTRKALLQEEKGKETQVLSTCPTGLSLGVPKPCKRNNIY